LEEGIKITKLSKDILRSKKKNRRKKNRRVNLISNYKGEHRELKKVFTLKFIRFWLVFVFKKKMYAYICKKLVLRIKIVIFGGKRRKRTSECGIKH
jgi:hypothetical protein